LIIILSPTVSKNSRSILLSEKNKNHKNRYPTGFISFHQAMIDRIRPLITYIIDNDFPTLGICFGHQMLGYFFGAQVLDDPEQAEFGSFPVSLSGDGRRDPLFRDVPDDFISFLMYRDSVVSLPEKCVLLAHSSRCGIGSFRYKNNIYGVQFHPELEKDEVCFRVTLHPEYAGESLETFLETLQPSDHASKILANFLRKSLC